MRRDFHPILLDHMRADNRIWLVTADLGFRMFDQIQQEFPDRFVNCGADESLMIGIGVGLADEGKIPVCYSISPFILATPYAWLRNYVNHERAPVKLLGAGRFENGKECYEHDGWTHHAKDAKDILGIMPNIRQFWPKSIVDLPSMTKTWLYCDGPAFLSLRR